MKKILILLAIVIGLTSCPARKHDLCITLVKFTREEYSQYVMGIRDADSVQTFQTDICSADEPIKMIYLSDGWWLIDALTGAKIVDYSAIGELTWEEFNNLPEEEKYPAISALKDAHPYADITQLDAYDIIERIDDIFPLIDSPLFISCLRKVIETGKLDKYRRDWITERMGLR